MGVDTFPTWNQGENVIEYAGRLRRYTGTIPKINPLVLLEFGRAQLRLNQLAKRVPLEAPWEAPGAARLDGQTVATWMRRNLPSKPARRVFELGIEAIWAAQPEDVSLLHVLFYIHSAGSLELLSDTEGGAQQDRFVGGSQLVPIRLAEQLGSERVILGAPVRAIRQSGQEGVILEADGVSVRARRAIVAVAPTLAGRLVYDPPLPGFRDQLTQRMPLGTVAKCMAIYPEPFWRNEGLTGQGMSDAGPVRLTFDNSPPGGSPGVLLGFLEGRRARELGRLPAEERRSAVVDCFARLYGPRAAKPDAYVERLWAEEEWSRGCYGCHMPTGAWTSYGPALREPIGRCTGPERSTQRCGAATWTAPCARAKGRRRRHWPACRTAPPGANLPTVLPMGFYVPQTGTVEEVLGADRAEAARCGHPEAAPGCRFRAAMRSGGGCEKGALLVGAPRRLPRRPQAPSIEARYHRGGPGLRPGDALLSGRRPATSGGSSRAPRRRLRSPPRRSAGSRASRPGAREDEKPRPPPATASPSQPSREHS